MNPKIYCDIMNRIRKMARENYASESDVLVTITLVNGEKFKSEIDCITLRDGYIQAWTSRDTYCFVPIINIVSINV